MAFGVVLKACGSSCTIPFQKALRGLKKKEVASVGEFADYEKRRKGEILFREGEYQDWMYEIREGRVGVYTAYGTPGETCLTEISEGGFVGELGLVYSAPRSATVVALTDVVLAKVTAENFSGYFQEAPGKVLMIMQQMSMRLRDLTTDYMEACRTIAELTGEGADKQAPGLLRRVRRFAGLYRKQ